MAGPLRLQNNVPEIYVNESRDFQLLCRLYDCIINGVKFDIDSIQHITDTSHCNSRLLDLLKTRLGFFNDKNIYSDDMRFVLEAFPYIIKYKGSKKGIIETLCLFMKINGFNSESVLTIDNENYIIKIGIGAPVTNTEILDEVLKYIIPTGYTYEYYFYRGANIKAIEIGVESTVQSFKDVYDGYVVRYDAESDKYVLVLETEDSSEEHIEDSDNIISNIGTTHIFQS